MLIFNKNTTGRCFDRTYAVHCILFLMLLIPKYALTQQIDACQNSSSPCNLLTSTTPQLSDINSDQLIVENDLDSNITSRHDTEHDTVSSISNLLQPYLSGNTNALPISYAIAETCMNKMKSPRLQQDCNALINAARENDTQTTSALLQIIPRHASKTNQIARAGSVAQINNLKSRFNSLRTGRRGLSLQEFDLHIYNQKLPIGKINNAYEKQRNNRSGLSAEQLRIDSNYGMFFTGDIVTSKSSLVDPDSSLKFNTQGVTFGTDYRLTKRLILGSALGYIDTNNSLLNGTGDLDTKGYSFSLYGTYSGREKYHLDFAASYGINNIQQQRLISYQLDQSDPVIQQMMANYNSDKFTLFFGSGYDFRNDFWTFQPRIDLQYIRSNVDGFKEQSVDTNAQGSGWASRTSAINRHWLAWNLGGKLSYTQDMNWGTLKPYSSIDWLHEYKDSEQNLNAFFLYDSDGNAIPITTSDPDRDYLRLKIGTSAKFKRGVEAYINYGTSFVHNTWSGQTFKVGFRMDL